MFKPQNQQVCQGETVTFSVNASASVPIFYQWQKDGSDIPGADASTYTILNSILNDNGEYNCLVFNAEGDTISTDLLTLVVMEEQTVSLDITASESSICEGDPVLFYCFSRKWWFQSHFSMVPQ